MVLNDVATNNVDDLTVAVFPRVGPIEDVCPDSLSILFRAGDVLDRRIAPNIEDEIRLFPGVRDPPLQITSDSPVSEFGFDPLTGLIARVFGSLRDGR